MGQPWQRGSACGGIPGRDGRKASPLPALLSGLLPSFSEDQTHAHGFSLRETLYAVLHIFGGFCGGFWEAEKLV